MRRTVTIGALAGLLSAGMLDGVLAQTMDGTQPIRVAHAGSRADGPDGRRGPRGEDAKAFAEARVAALHAGLALTPDQEKLWPPVAEALRDLATLDRTQREARRERGHDPVAQDAPDAIRARADALDARANALRKLADASQPLYATLDEAQKQRAALLSRPGGGPHGPNRHHRDD